MQPNWFSNVELTDDSVKKHCRRFKQKCVIVIWNQQLAVITFRYCSGYNVTVIFYSVTRKYLEALNIMDYIIHLLNNSKTLSNTLYVWKSEVVSTVCGLFKPS